MSKEIIGPKRKFARSFNIADEQAICADYEAGKRLKEIGEKWGAGEVVIWRILQAYGIKTSRRKYHYNERCFKTIDNEPVAYFLGYLTTDGYIVEGPHRYVVNLTSIDRDIPYAFAKWLGHGIPVYEIEPGHQKRNSIEYRVSACSKKMVQDLVQLGVRQAKSMKETFCKEVPDHLIHHYMRGIFDGDGLVGYYSSQGNRGQLRFGLVGSKLLLADYALQLHNRIGVPLKMPRRKSKNGLYKLSYVGNILARDILCWLYQGAHYFLSRKREIYERYKDIGVREWTSAHYGRLG